MSSLAIGIDLGTTFSAVAHVNQHGVPEILPNAHGDRITPSVILFDNDDVIVGIEAQRNAVAYAGQVVQFVKRNMGDPQYRFNYKGKRWTATELSSLILKELKKGAEQRLNQNINYAVITVPAYFGDRERRATIKAGEMAGLKVLKIINEPTAAAVAYGLNHRGSNRRCLVYDLGGGTFDVTIIDISNNSIKVRSTEGDEKLGGKDWDDRLMEYVAKTFQEEYAAEGNFNPLEDVAANHDLRGRCVSAKLALTQRPEVKLDFRYKNRPLRITITREKFEELTNDLLERTVSKTLRAVEESRSELSEIDTVLLVGGSTRMPMVRRRIREVFQKEPSTEINPDECVSLGAALTAALAAARERGQAPPVDIKTQDVAGHSLGVAVYKNGELRNTTIIRKNTPIPCENTKDNFYNTHNGQSMMDLWMLQGDSHNPLECATLGHFEFFGLSPKPAKESQISITYRYTHNGIVEVEARDLSTDNILSHRLSGDKYSLQDVLNGNIPAHIAVIMDCSGSMYGEALDAAKVSTNRFIEENIRSNRSIAIFTSPGGTKPVAGPHNDPRILSKALNELVAIGSTDIAKSILIARRNLKEKGTIFIILSDGIVDDPSAVERACNKVRKQGGRIFCIGVGPNVNRAFLQKICASKEDYADAYDPLSISHALNNIITQVD